MIYQEKSKNNEANYRALGILNHSYKVFSMVLRHALFPTLSPDCPTSKQALDLVEDYGKHS